MKTDKFQRCSNKLIGTVPDQCDCGVESRWLLCSALNLCHHLFTASPCGAPFHWQCTKYTIRHSLSFIVTFAFDTFDHRMERAVAPHLDNVGSGRITLKLHRTAAMLQLSAEFSLYVRSSQEHVRKETRFQHDAYDGPYLVMQRRC